jgi:hypothetical protein
MSAYICGPDHFKALAIFAATRDRGTWRVDPRYIDGKLDPEGVYASRGLENLCSDELATLYAEILFRENIRSVRARYPNDELTNLPGPVDLPSHIAVTHHDEREKALQLGPVAVLKMCDGLEYQSCETKDWRSTVAYALLSAIRKSAVRALPGYEDAPWDYWREEARASV